MHKEEKSLNPLIRGSIVFREREEKFYKRSQSPYKGFNSRKLGLKATYLESLNPPIRGSIEQDNALFKDYSHKR